MRTRINLEEAWRADWKQFISMTDSQQNRIRTLSERDDKEIWSRMETIELPEYEDHENKLESKASVWGFISQFLA